jgi:hydrogenase maturation protease
MRTHWQGRVGFLGLGNVLWGDDAAGVCLGRNLAAAGVPEVSVAGTSPERWLARREFAGLDHLDLLDAVEMGASPGAAALLDASEMRSRFPQCSTHKLSLGLLAQWIEHEGRTRAWTLGIQPGTLAAASPAHLGAQSPQPGCEGCPACSLTPAVRATVECLRTLVVEAGRSRSPVTAPELLPS